MAREKPSDKEKGMLKRMRRARGGRTLPRSGGGAHEDKKSKKIEQQLAEEADNEIKNWQQNAADELAEELDDFDEWEEWDDYRFGISEEEDDHYEEIRKDLKSKDKEKKDE